MIVKQPPKLCYLALFVSASLSLSTSYQLFYSPRYLLSSCFIFIYILCPFSVFLLISLHFYLQAFVFLHFLLMSLYSFRHSIENLFLKMQLSASTLREGLASIPKLIIAWYVRFWNSEQALRCAIPTKKTICSLRRLMFELVPGIECKND